MQDFRNLKVWQKAHQLVLRVYRVTAVFPREEIYGLTAQMRKSSSSVATNIAEGCTRGSDADFARFLCISMGSAGELEYQLMLAHDLSYLGEPDCGDLSADTVEVKRMLSCLISKLTTGGQ